MKRMILFAMASLLIAAGSAMAADCVGCHEKLSPGQVADWKVSKHFENDISCSDCHGQNHTTAEDSMKVSFPDEALCSDCHSEQFEQFSKGKHNFGWTSMNAMPITHIEPDELMEGGRGCGGCHNMGIKSEEQKKDQLAKGYRYQTNSCDECHTRHSFSKKEALNPRACQQCHMGYDHPQWEMWSSSKHGSRYLTQEIGDLPEGAAAPTCQDCHMPDGSHDNHTAWGFLGVRLPLPEDEQWKSDQIKILMALGVLNPETGEPTGRLDAVKAVDLARLTTEDFDKYRGQMLKNCEKCHSPNYAKEQLAMGDSIMQKADKLMGEAIDIVAALYKDGIIEKPEDYAFAYPDLLYFMRTGGGADQSGPYIEQVLFTMYMKHRMRTYQAFFHVNPDYAYWYGWAMMTEALGEIRELDATMRATHKK